MSENDFDRNKSELTHKITSGAQIYLKERGFKPIETEVAVDGGWVADLAGVVVPTDTELQYLKLIPRKPTYSINCEWLREKYGQTEYWKSEEYKVLQEKKQAEHVAWAALAKAVPAPLTALVEVKTTRSDYQRDDKWSRPHPVNLRYLAVPGGMLKRSEYPIGWFVLEFGVEGKLLRLAQQGTLEKVEIEKQMWTIHEIALRRHHRTEHVWMRDVNKRFNAEHTGQKQNMRVSNIISVMTMVINGGDRSTGLFYQSPEECLKARRIDFDSLSHWNQKEIKELWGKLKALSPVNEIQKVQGIETGEMPTNHLENEI